MTDHFWSRSVSFFVSQDKTTSVGRMGLTTIQELSKCQLNLCLFQNSHLNSQQHKESKRRDF